MFYLRKLLPSLLCFVCIHILEECIKNTVAMVTGMLS